LDQGSSKEFKVGDQNSLQSNNYSLVNICLQNELVNYF